MDNSDRRRYAQRIGWAIRMIRSTRALTQEDFSRVSSRTYLSALERGLQSPTLDKLLELAGVLGVHPATVVVLADENVSGGHSAQELERLLQRIGEECARVQRNLPPHP